MRSSPAVAVFIRCHKFSLKAAHLYSELDGGVGYDLFFMTDDTLGEQDYGSSPRVRFTLDDLTKFGLDTSWPMAVVHYGDMMFSIFRRAKPDYSYYVMLDFDVHFAYLGRAWLETFCHRLATNKQQIDLVAPQVGPAPTSWVWHAIAATRFTDVFGSFFPLVALSQRAIDCNERRRASEARTKPTGAEPVFCEAFLPSALHEAGQHLMTLNALLPDSYHSSSFDATLPAPFDPTGAEKICRLIHPIKAMIDAPLPEDARTQVLRVEPEREAVVSAQAAFETAAALVKDQAAFRGLLQAMHRGKRPTRFAVSLDAGR
jgi:hypothetical protein